MQTPPLKESVEVRAGLVLGRYELLVPIAAGGMAQVWAARLKGARQFQKIVAVKTMLPQLSDDAQFEQMFLDEASLASQVRHPNAVEILDLGEQDGILYLVMEWIEGVPLNHLMKAAKPLGGIPTPIAARLAVHACAGLHAAHELTDEKGQLVGLVHRDVSPQNLLVTFGGVTKVVDFGVAKATALGGEATQAGQVKGKVSYMAPEQVNGDGLDRRADVFALGIVLYALTTGKHPFRRESEAATMYNICSQDSVVPPSSVIEDYPAELEKVVLKALCKNRDERYDSCDAMLRALGSLPAELRVGSDADVGDFVQKLMGDKRLEQKKRLEEAIERADASPNGTWSGVDISQGRAPLNSLMSNPELSGVGTGLHPHANRNRLLGVAGLVALAVSGGALATMMLNRGAPPARVIRMIEAKEVPVESEEEGTIVALDSLPEENSPEDDEEANADEQQEKAEIQTKAKVRQTSRKVAPQATKEPVKPPAPAPSSNWKTDAGF